MDTPETVAFMKALSAYQGGSGLLMHGGAAGFRECLDALVLFFGVSTREGEGITPASFRPGGATFWFRAWDSPDRLRFRGRWMSVRMLEIYLQEVMVSKVLADLPFNSRRRIQLFAAGVGDALAKSTATLRMRAPRS